MRFNGMNGSIQKCRECPAWYFNRNKLYAHLIDAHGYVVPLRGVMPEPVEDIAEDIPVRSDVTPRGVVTLDLVKHPELKAILKGD